jgi:MGT family glycosyltransferase
MSTFLFMPESAYGPTNNCIGIGARLRDAGHRVIFAAERSWEGKLSAMGFEEDLVDLAPAAEPSPDGVEPDAGQFWIDFIRDTSPEFRKPTVEQLESFVRPTWQALIDGAMFCEPQLREIVARSGADVLVEDNVVCFPALVTAGKKFARIMSCNPLEVRGADIAPVFSGLPADDRSEWDSFRAAYDSLHREQWEAFNAWCISQGTPALPDLDYIHEGALNLYVYPELIDYTDRRALGSTWHRLDSSVRTTDEPWSIPESIGGVDDPRPLVYFSLGSLGSADVDLVRRILAVLADTPYRYVVSMGPRADEITLPDNAWGAQFVPQTSVMPYVDLVITHGGNNTTTEAFHFGKPMILMPLFWDQYDNAQRVHETGYGVRLATYDFTDDELRGALARLLGDTELRARMAANGELIRGRDGLGRAAELLAQLASS